MSGELFQNLALGLATALSPANVWFCFLGVFLGTLLGVIPGIGALLALSLLFPFTFYMEPAAALIMLAGIYYGTAYGGSTAAILLNLPGTPSSAVACLDGYPMSKQGRAGVALLMTAIASFIGGVIGIVILILFGPVIADVGLRFGAQEYFALMLLGLVAAATMSNDSPLKGIAAVSLGMLVGTVGVETNSGVSRFTFGVLELYDGISLVALALGLFGISEVIAGIGGGEDVRPRPTKVTFQAMRPTKADLKMSWAPALRGSAVGSFFGALPGTGPTLAAFIAYASEVRLSRTPERFGTGAVEGLVAPEAANNAADQTAFIPTLTLGIPGTATMAIMLGVLIIHGITPGPRFMFEQPHMFWGLVMSFWIGNIMLVILNVPLIGLWVSILRIPYHLLYPAVVMFVCMGAYSVGRSSAEVWMTAAVGAAGYALRISSYPLAPLLLGFILGPMIEENFARSLILSRGDPLTFVYRPISGSIMGITFLILLWAAWSGERRRRERRSQV